MYSPGTVDVIDLTMPQTSMKVGGEVEFTPATGRAAAPTSR
jgi:hypothetical protein